jgi:hypothetical protein
LHLLNKQKTTHRRLNIREFFKRYTEELEKRNPPEDEDDTIIKDISDLYQMLGIPKSDTPKGIPDGETGIPDGETGIPDGDKVSPERDSLNSPDASLTHPIGTDVPLLENLPIDWQMAAGVEKVVIPNQDEAKRIDFANLVAMGTSNPSAAREIALIFQNERNITLPTDEKKVKGQRKAIVEMLGYGVTPNHVVQAIRKLLTNRMTFTDLFGVAKTAIDLATQPQNYAGNGSHAL